ncbi:MAG: glycine cleavage system protein R, partial [Gammaproteobacteria bacterium]|nr:glycine cleavage system protein R [Gammaproteobacteria bacterium]MBT6952468.1 glycine cleavage system protein R [Gammaproteobacteria bacterium]
MRFFILSFIGDDRPGFVHEITDVVSRYEGSWLESRM